MTHNTTYTKVTRHTLPYYAARYFTRNVTGNTVKCKTCTFILKYTQSTREREIIKQRGA